MYIDTHCHLSDARFEVDRDLVIKRAHGAGVGKMVEVACEPSLWKPSFDISVLNPDIFCAYGLHPHEAKHFNEEVLTMLEKLLQDKKAVAVGETGLDYFYNYSTPDAQKTVFRIHIKLARKLNKPLVIHCRQAYPDLFEILKSEKTGDNYRGVVHCFSGSAAEAAELIGMGFFIGIDGPVTYPSAKTLREVVKVTPLENMLIETDSPYLPPQEYRGKRNEPSYVALVAAEIAMLKQTTVETVAGKTTENALKLFNI
jgi:TatD DNase family protein